MDFYGSSSVVTVVRPPWFSERYPCMLCQSLADRRKDLEKTIDITRHSSDIQHFCVFSPFYPNSRFYSLDDLIAATLAIDSGEHRKMLSSEMWCQKLLLFTLQFIHTISLPRHKAEEDVAPD